MASTIKTIHDLPNIVDKYSNKLTTDTKQLLQHEFRDSFCNFPEIRGMRWCQHFDSDQLQDFEIKAFNEWYSPWNDTRIENVAILESVSRIQEKLTDAEQLLFKVFGSDIQVTITEKDTSINSL